MSEFSRILAKLSGKIGMKHPKFGKQYTGAELGVYRRSAVVPSSGENPDRLYDNNVRGTDM